MSKDFYDICGEVWKWEQRMNTPYKDCLTEWFGDLAMCVPLPGVTDGQILARYQEILKETPVARATGNAKYPRETSHELS